MRADYKLIAKALQRKGSCLVQLGRLEEAIAIFNKSLTEHRTPETLAKLNATEKTLKEKVRGIGEWERREGLGRRLLVLALTAAPRAGCFGRAGSMGFSTTSDDCIACQRRWPKLSATETDKAFEEVLGGVKEGGSAAAGRGHRHVQQVAR